MRRLIFALAAIAAGAVFASPKTLFEQNFNSASADDGATAVGFAVTSDGGEADTSKVVVDDSSKYFELNTGSNKVYKTLNQGSADRVYLDTKVQFQQTKEPATLDTYDKLGIYLSTNGYLYALCGASGTASKLNTNTTLEEEVWYRLVVFGEAGSFKVSVRNDAGDELGNGTFESHVEDDATITEVAFKGAGAIDDFLVATGTPDAKSSELEYYFDAGKGTAADPYKLGATNDLQALKDAFANVAAAHEKNYVLTGDIDATGLGYWDGIGTYGTADSGLKGATFDGAGHTISNLSFSSGKYRALFNRVDGSTIKDLTINVAGFKDTDAEEHGYAAFAGKVVNSTIKGCTATGTIGTTAKPAMHTCGGFAVATDGGTAFVDCTNYVDIVCSLKDNPKIGGIVGLVQNSASAITNCWNFGDLTITPNGVKASANGAGGLVGYAQVDLTIYGGGNEGTITWSKNTTGDSANNAVKTGTIIGMASSGSTTVSGGVVAQTNAAPAGAFANVSGLTYATVSGDVATFVPDAELAKDNTYTLFNNVAASETPVFTLAAAGDTIAFTLNGKTFAGTVAAAGELKVTMSDYTYTARTAADAAAAEADAVAANADVGLTKNDALKTFLSNYEVLDNVDLSDSTAVAAAMNATAANGNGLTYKESYVLNLDPTDSTSTLKAVTPNEGAKVDDANNKLIVKVPAPRADTGYTVTYQVKRHNGSEWVNEGDPQSDSTAVKIPLGSGRYRVDAVLSK